jgi:hypothetical protein
MRGRALRRVGRAHFAVVLLALGAAPLAGRELFQVDSPDSDYARGMELARLEHWGEARRAFEAGQTKAPRDKRFPLELAGVAFKQGRRAESKRLLRTALRLDPRDPYTLGFLATLYYLEGNLRAALGYWNRTGQPRIGQVQAIPEPRVRPALFDRALAFSPAAVLELREVEATDARLGLLGIFPSRRFELVPKQDGRFDLELRLQERNGWVGNRLQALASFLRGLPYATVYPEAYNLGRAAANSESLLRWDRDKQRVASAFSLPLRGDPAWRFRAAADARRENWEVSRSARPAALDRTDFRMKKLEAAIGVDAVAGGRLRWQTGFAAARRTFTAPPGGLAPAALFTSGLSLEHRASVQGEMLSLPDRRLSVRGDARWKTAKVLGRGLGPYGRGDAGVRVHWAALSREREIELSGGFRAGALLGAAPFDELFDLGLERDNDLALRGHAGAAGGRKGSGPLGRRYVIIDCGVQRVLHRGALWSLRAGPFLDTGKAYDTAGVFGSQRWLWDAGLEVRLTLLERVELTLSYGRDLRTGRNVFYTRTR